MKNFAFLFKPAFYIFSLVFATWLVIEVEKFKPSDNSNGEKLTSPVAFPDPQRYLRNVCSAYKSGLIDSAALDRKLDYFLSFSRRPQK